jgi:DNA-binding NarL/FixJ family response regulator
MLHARACPDARPPEPCDDPRMSCTVLIVDDHAAFRSAARALLEAFGFEVLGEAADGTSALAAAVTLKPELVLLDVQLPDIDGFDVARRLAIAPDPMKVVLISSRAASSYRRRLADTPAAGFISKSDLSGAALLDLIAG